MKTCSKCKLKKSFNNFHKNSSKKDGFRSQCIPCRREYFKGKIEEKASYDKIYYSQNIKIIKQKSKIFRTKNAEKFKAYRQKHKERIRIANLNFKITHPDYFKIKAKEWVKNNPKKRAIIKEKHRMATLNVEGSHTWLEWEKILDDANGWCSGINKERHYVGRTNLTKDHILPVQPKNIEMRGTNNADNIQALCKSCNSSKGNRILERIIK